MSIKRIMVRHWSLVIGHWSLVTGHYLLSPVSCPLAPGPKLTHGTLIFGGFFRPQFPLLFCHKPFRRRDMLRWPSANSGSRSINFISISQVQFRATRAVKLRDRIAGTRPRDSRFGSPPAQQAMTCNYRTNCSLRRQLRGGRGWPSTWAWKKHFTGSFAGSSVIDSWPEF